MAEVYDYVKGEKLEKLIANHEDSQAAVKKAAEARGSIAEATLAAARDRTGAAKIVIETGLDDVNYGHIDWFVVLDDESAIGNDPLRALTIEYGRKGGGKNGASRPVKPLRTAFPEIGGGE